ncbi:MAG: chromosome segregation protein SMC, partial [Pseudomonadales bacterium]|nr:chromosome segregation protein SMC [Pseudomonadales bacterium]
QSVCVDQINDFVSSVAELDAGALRLLSASDASTAANQAVSLPLLLSKVANPELLSSILAGVYVADTVEQALPALQALSMQESIVTADGLWLSRHWLRKLDQQDAQAGLLKRKQEIEQLHAVIAEQSSEKQALQSSQTDTQLKLSQTERERDELQKSYQLRSTKQSELSSQLSAKKLKVEQVLQRREQIQTDLDDTKLQYQLEQESLAEARAILQQAIEDMESDAGQRESLVSERDNIRSRLDQARDQANSDKDRAYQLAMQEQSLKTQISALQQSLDRAREQVEQLLERRTQLQIEIAEIEQPDDDSALALEALLDKRLTVEQELSAARTELDTIEHDMREVERERNLIQQTIQKHRSDLEQSRIAAQTWQVQQENLQKQIEDAEFSVATLIEELPEHASESVWQEEIESLARRIARLGAINLAAIEEYKLAAERKTYLDAQNADLETALSTLENAIRKIDKETRQRFKDTFDQINLGVQDLFPKVFGGGRAYLELTGDDLLDTGVAIMAQPPGKKNSTIHLLSGGEKALTAIALVFSIFKLNPAPFCILDEVDAPLDDANVGRYARMVKEMSEQVQFIYISHNKIAMEMADQLLGVTMHEPGCSRVVSVDIEEAAELAAL